jgi:hypothetical protein
MALLAAALLLAELGAGLFVVMLRGQWFAAKRVALAAVGVGGAYLAVLAGVSAASPARVTEPGDEKHVCEPRCHLAYSVAASRRASTLGAAKADGAWEIVTLRVRFDGETVSPERGDAPLAPNPRSVWLIDEKGRRHAPSAAGLRALEAEQGRQPPLTRALRPGETYTTALVFDVPEGAGRTELVLAAASPVARLLIGHENSVFHRPATFRLDSASHTARAGDES